MVVAHKSNLMLIGVVLSVVLAACSGNANTTAETNPASQTTVAKVCNPPAQLDCAGADLRGANLANASLRAAVLYEANLSGANLTSANLTSANLTGATMPDGTIHD